MIEPRYAINCLKLGFERYKRYSKLPIEIKVSKSTASFYVKKPDEGRGKMHEFQIIIRIYRITLITGIHLGLWII